MNKKGVSPAIATVLLIAIALVLAVIIFLWARSYIGESVQKSDRAIESSCAEVVFEAEAFSDGSVAIQNNGNVPIYGIEVREKSLTGWSIELSDSFSGPEIEGNGIGNGESASIDGGTWNLAGEELVVIPILLGSTETRRVTHVCDSDYGIEVSVEA